ncbi:hemerythrin domain-containing protein [Flexivirga alba]|uniref:Hemerythrin domain-containing protein n=1 Tax=Flexivirga alba TaxID=702742 RepID=A0ABW2AKX7_9MICO
MTLTIETQAEAQRRRESLRGHVDFTMMYVAHDAFNRDLCRLVEAVGRGRLDVEVERTWRVFTQQLHTHHSAEDQALWPPLRQAVDDRNDLAILDAMEREHAQLDPRIDAVETALANRETPALVSELAGLADGLAKHMRHEENTALPLLDRTLGNAGWDDFVARIRQENGGLRGGAAYLPWVLDGASDQLTAAVLTTLPAPARWLYRHRWAPRYRQAGGLR